MNYAILKVTGNTDHAHYKGRNTPKKGFAAITYRENGDVEFYDLRGPVCTTRQFTNWAKRSIPMQDGDFDIRFG